MTGRTLGAAACLAAAVAFFCLSVLEISFPGVLALAAGLDALVPGLGRHRIPLGLAAAGLAGSLLVPAFRLDEELFEKVVETASRLGLGGMFAYASWFKIQDPRAFALLVAQYRFLPREAVNLFALILPPLELLVAFLLVGTRWTRESAWLLLALFLAFIAALAQAIGRNLGITCGCFELEGTMDKQEAWISLVRDLVLLAPVVWLLFRPGRTLPRIWVRGE